MDELHYLRLVLKSAFLLIYFVMTFVYINNLDHELNRNLLWSINC